LEKLDDHSLFHLWKKNSFTSNVISKV